MAIEQNQTTEASAITQRLAGNCGALPVLATCRISKSANSGCMVPALVQLAATCGRDPLCNLIALATVVGERMVRAALLSTADTRPALGYREPAMDDREFRAMDRLMRERAAGELGSAV